MRTITRPALLALAVAVSLLASATGVLADTPVSHSGVFGAHYLQDTFEYAGVHCHYSNPGPDLDRIRVRFPIVYARDLSAGRDSQEVGWRFNLQSSPTSSGPWTTIYRSPVERLSAFDDSPALFHGKTYSLHGEFGVLYRVLIGMRWYAVGGNTIEGNVTHRVDYHAYAIGYPAASCPGGIL